MNAPKTFVWLSLELLDAYRREERAIERRYPYFTDPPEGVSLSEHWETLALLRQAAKRELRDAARDAARALADQGLKGSCPIAI